MPPNIEAVGNQFYCPLSQINIVTSFDIIDPDDTEIEAFHIQISTGYVNGQDMLTLNGFHPNITSTWIPLEGKLTFTGVGGNLASYIDIIAAVQNVVFSSNSVILTGGKYFSFTIGDANYLPSTNHYYEYVQDTGITWTQAKIDAEARTYFGLQGYLATITSTQEAQLSGEQAAGAGWIGGTDQETEGIWKWATGPEIGTVFWNGGINGSSPNYSNWNNAEPNNLGNEDYAHVTAPGIGIDGSWNDLSNGGDASPNSPYHPQGFIVEYGGTPGDPVVNISASTKIVIPIVTSTGSAEQCGPGSLVINADSSSGNIVWFDAPTGGNQLGTGNIFNTPIINATTTYYALATPGSGCTEGARVPVVATILEFPTVVPNFVLKNCDEDGVSDGYTNFNLNEANMAITLGNLDGMTITYHLSLADANTGANSINQVPFNNSISNSIFARVENTNGCFSISNVTLSVSTTSFTPGFIQEIINCDDDLINDGFFEFDLTQASQSFINEFPSGQNLSVHYYRTSDDAHLEQNEITTQTAFTNETPYTQLLYVRVERNDSSECFGIGPHLMITVVPRPEFDLDMETVLCLNIGPTVVSIYNADGNYTYEWIDSSNSIISNLSSATISSGGVYNVVATSVEGCKSLRKTVNVMESDIADISIDDITIRDFSNNNSISIDDSNNNLGIGDYEYALDNNFGSYQDEPFFDGLQPGIHELFVRDKNQCGVVKLEIFILGFPKFFTPNNDGYNDTWNIAGLSNQFMKSSTISIYDRYGKLIKQLSPWDEGWNGFFNGQALETSDYWFVTELIYQGKKKRILRGHFSLVR